MKWRGSGILGHKSIDRGAVARIGEAHLRNHRAENGAYGADIPEAYLNLHLPIFTEGGIDLKLGKLCLQQVPGKGCDDTFATAYSRMRIQPVIHAASSPIAA